MSVIEYRKPLAAQIPPYSRTEILTRPWWLDWMLDRFRWYRRFCGGHWEQWYVQQVRRDMWFQRTGCHREIGRPPRATGIPECEDHR